ncbi:MAG: hypothetical protein CMO55_11460 [Verrucomicrobiales bacterium]|nr:hypothetical protein [Verrucomicrobiales bacterium]
MGPNVFALAWYTEEEYSKFQHLSADPEVWDESYESWKTNAESTIRELEAHGATVAKIDISFTEIQQWCAMAGKPNDSSARSEFAAAKHQSTTGLGT